MQEKPLTVKSGIIIRSMFLPRTCLRVKYCTKLGALLKTVDTWSEDVVHFHCKQQQVNKLKIFC